MSAKVFSFLKKIKPNNNREWFTNHRDLYEEAKSDFTVLVGSVIAEIGSFDASISANIPEKCVFRIHRDVRFSNDKTPYKTHMGAYIAPGGKSAGTAGYYIHLEPDNSFVAAGLFAPDSKTLQIIRQEIYYNPNTFLSIVEKPSFVQKFEGLLDEKIKRPPKGFDKNFPYIEWVKFKHYVVSAKLSQEQLQSPDLKYVISDFFREAFPLVQYLNRALQMAEK